MGGADSHDGDHAGFGIHRGYRRIVARVGDRQSGTRCRQVRKGWIVQRLAEGQAQVEGDHLVRLADC